MRPCADLLEHGDQLPVVQLEKGGIERPRRVVEHLVEMAHQPFARAAGEKVAGLVAGGVDRGCERLGRRLALERAREPLGRDGAAVAETRR